MKMKTQTTKLKAFLRLASVLSIAGFCSLAQAAIVVNMEVGEDQEGNEKLIITTHGTCSGNNPERGCMKVTGKDQQMNFNLIGNRVCKHAPPGSRWVLDSLVLSNTENGPPPLRQEAVDDFEVDQETGIVTGFVSKNPKHMGILNANTKEYEVWYTVNAVCAGGSKRINTDPRIQNDGTGGTN